MTSLLARLPRREPGAPDGPRVLPVGWSGVAASVAVSVTGLLGLWLGLVVIATLDPTGGLGPVGSAQLAGRLWLAAQGASFQLGSGPLVLAPLLLTAGIAWGITQAGRWVARRSDVTGGRRAAVAVAVLAVVHTAIALGVAGVVDAPEAAIGYTRTAVGVAVLSVVAAGLGVGRESGLLGAGLDALPGPGRAIARAVVAGSCTLVGLSLVVVAIALASDAAGSAVLMDSLGGASSGALGLLALCALLLPNAAFAVVGLGAGPGFVVGSGTLVSVGGVTLGAVPALPLLAALPDTQAVPLLAFVTQAVPALAGLVTGVTLGRHLRHDDGRSVVAGLWGVAAGALLGVAAGLGAWAAGGQLGDGALAEVGAPALATGLAVAAQAGIAAAVGAAVARWRSPD